MTVFAAASLGDVVDDLVDGFGADGWEVTVNVAGSNTLAQQIHAADGADIFLSADVRWVDWLESRGRTVPAMRRNFASNRLVVVARADAPYTMESLDDLPRLDIDRLALADPEAVPAGRYARAHLEQSSLYGRLVDQVVPTLDVRAALGLVESDPRIVGIVYETDAVGSDKVQILHTLEPLPGIPIEYCAVMLDGAENPSGAALFLDFLVSPEASAIFERHGFTHTVLDPAHSNG